MDTAMNGQSRRREQVQAGPIAQALRLDAGRHAEELMGWIRHQVQAVLRRRGVVIGLSGGVDSSVVAALCARALGPERVLGLVMPERDSSPDSRRLAEGLAGQLGIECRLEEIDAPLEALGCRQRQTEAIRSLFPDYGEGWRCKLTLPSILEGNRLNVFLLTVRDPQGRERTGRLPAAAYLQLVAATNFKQRVRKSLEYYHADRLRLAVAGTPNRLELDQGFFVKQGDGAADLKPIAHLYKTQVYQLAEHLGVPEEIRARPPSTETYSLPLTQEEFFFALPYQLMDLCLYAHDHQLPPAQVAQEIGVSEDQVRRVFRDIDSKRQSAHYLHAPPLMVGSERV